MEESETLKEDMCSFFVKECRWKDFARWHSNQLTVIWKIATCATKTNAKYLLRALIPNKKMDVADSL